MIGGNIMKIKLMTAALSAVMLVSGAAFALDMDPKFYVGGEIQANNQKGPKALTKNGVKFVTPDGKPIFGKSSAGASLFFGTKLNEFFGLEAGATGFSRLKYNQT